MKIMEKISVVLFCFLVACSTKNYGRQGELTEFEKKEMTCREIDIEISKTMGFIDHVGKESEFDGRSVLSFVGDFWRRILLLKVHINV